jgi:4-amino-4-deoxy-L-arabinose transferase-like glycosyltransferase
MKRDQIILSGMIAAIILLSILLAIPLNPKINSLSLDSGLYAYAARVIIEGGTLYRDVWDHKPPAVFYVNVIALTLFGNDVWGIWYFGIVWNAILGIAFFLIAKIFASRASALIGTIVTLITLQYPLFYNLGNQNEVYACLFQLLNLWAGVKFFESRNHNWLAAVGVFTSIAFLFKATYIGAGAAVMLIVLAQELRAKKINSTIQSTFRFLLFFLIPIILTSIYFASQGLLAELWRASIVLNFAYNREGFSLPAFTDKLLTLFVHPPLSLIIVITLFAAVIYRRNDKRISLAPIFLAIPIEIALLFLSSRAFGHYYMTLLPALGLALIYGIDRISASRQRMIHAAGIVILLLWAFSALKAFPSASEISILVDSSRTAQIAPIEQYIIDHTSDTSTVLTWSNYIGINFAANVPFPSKYVFVSQLFDFPPDQMDIRFFEFLAELDQQRPILILIEQVPSTDMPVLSDNGKLLQCRNCTDQQMQNLIRVKSYLHDHYALIDKVDGWLVYRRASTP